MMRINVVVFIGLLFFCATSGVQDAGWVSTHVVRPARTGS